jgi:hypothetical protein
VQKPDCQVKSNGDALGSDVEVEDLELTVQHRELWIQGEAIHRGKVKDVEGEVVVDPSKQVERRSGYGKVQGSVKAPVPLKMHGCNLVQVQGALFALKVGTKWLRPAVTHLMRPVHAST